MKEPSIGNLVKPDPQISIIIPVYNSSGTIAETLGSVFAQTFTDLEVIVINDGSPDSERLYDALEPFRERIVFIDRTFNEGTSAARNRAASAARGEYLIFLDADDIWHPQILSELAGYLTEQGLDVAYTDCESFTTGNGPQTDLRILNPPQGIVTRKMLIEGRCHILPSGTLIKKSVFDAAGGFDPDVTRTEDFDLWMRMLFAGVKFGYLRKLLFRFRVSPGSGSGDAVIRIERSITCWRTLQKKLEFTADEIRAIERHIADHEAAILRTKGRDQIYGKDWPAARRTFRLASEKAAELGLPLLHRIKLKMVILLLGVSPSLLRVLYTKFRQEELEYLPSGR